MTRAPLLPATVTATRERQERVMAHLAAGGRDKIYRAPDLSFRLDDLNEAHAFVTVFDAGSCAGNLTLRRATWEYLEGNAR